MDAMELKPAAHGLSFIPSISSSFVTRHRRPNEEKKIKHTRKTGTSLPPYLKFGVGRDMVALVEIYIFDLMLREFSHFCFKWISLIWRCVLYGCVISFVLTLRMIDERETRDFNCIWTGHFFFFKLFICSFCLKEGMDC